jgi:uncharacterized membrane protein
MTTKRVLIGFTTLCLILVVYAVAIRISLRPVIDLPPIPGGVPSITVILLLFSLSHAFYSLGWRLALIFFGLSIVISWIFEDVGVATGLVYGAYHYTDALGPKLGHVPFLIPIAWFMMIYPSYVLANLIADARPVGSSGGIVRILWLALLSAVIMTAWDVKMDPGMSGSTRPSWIWDNGGGYFGVPMQNYFGWLLTTFTVYGIYRLIERRLQPQPMGRMTTAFIAMPLIAYVSMFIADVVVGSPTEFRIISPFVMGFPALVAAGRLFSDARKAEQVTTAQIANADATAVVSGLAQVSNTK